MTPKRFLRAMLLPVLMLFAFQVTIAQDKTVTGKVTDTKDGSPVAGASVTVKGFNVGTSTASDGSFRISVPSSATALIISSVGFGTKEATISDQMTVSLVSSVGSSLNEVVVTGYGTSRKKDLTGAVTSVKAKDFNQGVFSAPDQLIQGKVAGVQVVSNTGAPGGAATIRIRGVGSIRSGNSPLIVVDGVPLSGGSAAAGNGTPLGGTPGENPLNFINPSDIASMDVLKDASATAIFGSRGANGVILITTKKGASGAPRIEFNTSVGFSNLLKRIDVLDGDEYRAALAQYNITSGGNSGANVDALDAILRTALQQNYNIAVSGGNENSKYRLSAGYLDQQGIVEESGFKKISANLSTAFRFLDSKKLGLDINLLTSNTKTDIAPISNDAGFQGSLIANALQWNPTIPLYKAGGDSVNRIGGSTINPVDLINAYDDVSTLTTVLASISPSYKILDNLEYRMLYSVNYGIGERNTEIRSYLNIDAVLNRGYAQIANNKQVNQQLTHTLTYSPKIGRNLNLNAVIGYEYLKYDFSGHGMTGTQFVDYPGLKYTDYMQNVPAAARTVYSFANPISELQSYFARATFNWADRLLVTATYRADGSSKFGANNKYGYFPSIAAAWNISNEEFLGNANFISNLKLRASWGQTGNQEFPSGTSIPVVGIGTGGNQNRVNFENPNIKWETNTMTNIGIDFGIIDNRITGTFDWFNRQTEDPIFQFDVTAPGPTVGRYWRNLEATIENSGFEVALMGAVIRNERMQWNVGFNIAFLKNQVNDLVGNYETGALHGQGITGTTVQRLTSGQPLNVYYTRKYEGLDKATGVGVYTDDEAFFYQGSPNPKQVYGITTDFTWNKFFAVVNMNGASGHYLYNNTFNSVIPIGNLGTRNIASSLIGGPVQESTSNAIKASSRYIEKGDYMKLANATIGYRLGSLGKAFSNVTATITGQNLFIITKFQGFDPEVNVDKNVGGVPSFGIEYSPYPSARTILFGLNFSL